MCLRLASDAYFHPNTAEAMRSVDKDPSDSEAGGIEINLALHQEQW